MRQGNEFKTREAERSRKYRAKGKIKRAEKDSVACDCIIRLRSERNQLKNTNTTLRNQMYSDMAIQLKDRGIERKGKDKYNKEFEGRLECLEENYVSPYDESSSDKDEKKPSEEPKFKNKAV